MPGEQLPEGTDAIETGAGVDAFDEADADALDDAAAALTVSKPRAASGDSKAPKAPLVEDAEPQSLTDRIEGLKGQAGDSVRDFVTGAKDRATDGIEDVVRMIHDAAAEVDAKIGTQYGDYIRRAGDSVSGFSDALKQKDVDSLFADTRELIKASPGIAVGAAASIGFVIARLVHAGVAEASAAPGSQKG